MSLAEPMSAMTCKVELEFSVQTCRDVSGPIGGAQHVLIKPCAGIGVEGGGSLVNSSDLPRDDLA